MPSTYILDVNDPYPPPIHMDCMYDLRPDESGFVLKWLLDGNPVYQWIPPKRPQAISFFKTRADPTYEVDGGASLERYRSLNIVRPEFNMTGEFTCSVQTFQSSDKRSAKLQIIGERHLGQLSSPLLPARPVPTLSSSCPCLMTLGLLLGPQFLTEISS